jgi:hypothetical protein
LQRAAFVVPAKYKLNCKKLQLPCPLSHCYPDISCAKSITEEQYSVFASFLHYQWFRSPLPDVVDAVPKSLTIFMKRPIMFISSSPTRTRSGPTAMILGAAGACASMAVLPYAIALLPGLFARVPVSMPVFVVAQCIQALIILTLLSWAGFRLAHAVGLTSPILQSVAARTTFHPLPGRSLQTAAIAGAATGFALIAFDKLSMPLMPVMKAQSLPEIALWKRLLASFYGGVTEETLCRLFLMSLLVWLYVRISSPRSTTPTHRAMWLGIIGAALVFGLLHLPAAFTLWPMTPLVIGRTLVLNGLGGILFGWLYWRRGLEHAMVAHFLADVVLHGLGGY